jgi:hypothetical protein
MMTEKLDPGNLTPENLARLLSVSAKRLITGEQVRLIAETGNLLSTTGTINLIQYTAFVAGESGEVSLQDGQ